jgi:methionine-rich copper-binding protein CopC
MHIRTIKRLTALALVAALAAIVAVPAFAHAPVLGTSPKKNATVSTVRTVSVRFGEAVLTGLITVKHAGGSTVKAQVSGLASGKKRLRATFANKLAAGKYTVSWRVKADDGDTEKGTFKFTVR